MELEKKDIFDRIMLLPVLRLFYAPYKKYKSVLLYIFFGGLTTIVSIGSFILFNTGLNVDALLANIFSWVCAVLFAYATNRVWVFASKAKGTGVVKEMLSFFTGRLVTLGLEEVLILIFVTLLSFNSTLIKTLGQVVVLVLNYVISKLFVFRSKGTNDEE